MPYKVLIVDDERMARDGLRMMVNTLNEWVWAGEATNGVTALEKIKLHKPDLILLDIRMPEMDGLSLLGKIREMGLDTLVVFLTGHPDFEYAQKAIRYGAFDYLLKPMRAPDIIEIIKKAEIHLDEASHIKQEYEESLRMAKDYERELLERNMREVIYGGTLDELSISNLSMFSDCDRLTVASILLDSNNNSLRGPCENILRNELQMEYASPFLVLQDGPSQWTILLGERSVRTPSIELNQLFDKIGLELCAAGIVNWRIGIGQKIQFAQASKSYEQSKFAAYFASTDKKIVFYEKLTDTDATLLLIPIDLEYAIIQHVREGNPDEAMRVFDKVADHYSKMTIRELEKHAVHFLIQLQNGNERLDDGNTLLEYVVDGDSENISTIIMRLRQVVKDYAERTRSYLNIQMNHVIQRVIRIIHEKYATNIKLGEIAEVLGVNPSYLSTLFKQETGVSFSDYLSRYRIERAKLFLKEANLKIYEVAQRVGYTDGRHFSQLFRRSQGLTPLEYRNRNGIFTEHDELINE